MTTIDGIRQDEKITVPGHLIERIDFLSRMLGRSRSEVIVLAFDNFAPPVEHAAPGGRPGVGVQPCAPAPEDDPEAPTVAAIYTDPDGDRLTLLALHGRPADWSLVPTTADGEVERDVFFEDDETLAGWCRMGLGAIEDRQR